MLQSAVWPYQHQKGNINGEKGKLCSQLLKTQCWMFGLRRFSCVYSELVPPLSNVLRQTELDSYNLINNTDSKDTWMYVFSEVFLFHGRHEQVIISYIHNNYEQFINVYLGEHKWLPFCFLWWTSDLLRLSSTAHQLAPGAPVHLSLPAAAADHHEAQTFQNPTGRWSSYQRQWHCFGVALYECRQLLIMYYDVFNVVPWLFSACQTKTSCFLLLLSLRNQKVHTADSNKAGRQVTANTWITVVLWSGVLSAAFTLCTSCLLC